MLRRSLWMLVGLFAILAIATITGCELVDSLAGHGLKFDGCSPYCESKIACRLGEHAALLRQPINTYSSLAYIAVGYLALASSRRSGFGFALGFACTAFALGGGSFLFHATLTRDFRWLDVVGMYASLCSLVFYGLHRIAGARTSVIVAGWISAIAGLAWYKWSIDTTLWTLILVGWVGVCLVVHGKRTAMPLWRIHAPLGFLALGWAFRQLDVAGHWCDPSHIYQGHAVWHVLTAAALWLAWWNLSTTRPVKPTRQTA